MLALFMVLASVPPWSSLDDGQRADVELSLKTQPMPGRLVATSERFLGTPYVLSPLGEGEGHDADPLVRFDAVDCVTMVEEAMALGLTPDDSQLVPLLNRIRYSTEPGWNTRNHLMEAQWLPQNIAKGYLKDVTRTLGGALTKRVVKTLTKKSWTEKSARSLALEASAQPLGDFALDIIPAAKALAVLEKAKPGLIVVVVRADRPNLVTRVSHVGVLVQGPSGPMLRHASRSFKRVVDEPLAHYLTRNLDFAKWTIEGLALFEPTEPPPPSTDTADASP